MAPNAIAAQVHDPGVSHRPSGDDPRAAVRAPFVAALNGIVLRAAIGFVVVAAVTALPLLVKLDDAIHGAVHVALPIGWLAYAGVTGWMNRRAGPIAGNPWAHAAEAEPGLTRFASAISGFMIGGWLAAVIAVLVHHHLGSPLDIAATLAVDLPALTIPWALASWAWARRCRHVLARAESRSNDLLRLYWREIPR